MNPYVCSKRQRKKTSIDALVAQPAFLYGFQTSFKQLDVLLPSRSCFSCGNYSFNSTIGYLISPQKRLLLIKEGRLCTILTHRLLFLQGQRAVQHPCRLGRAIISQRHVWVATIPGFNFGDDFLKQRAEIEESRDFKQRFRKMHDDMCHREEWDFRLVTGNGNRFQQTFETAYSDHELRRETVLTELYRSVKGISKTLDYIETNYVGDDDALREQFSGSYYQTLRVAENDLKNVGNLVYSEKWIVAVERMIEFCLHMYYLNTKPCETKDPHIHLISLEQAHKFILLLMDAYRHMWAQHVMPPNCDEFCAISLATSALVRRFRDEMNITTKSSEAGGLAALCRAHDMLPSHVRQSTRVQRSLEVLLCYFSDNTTRFFELLDDKHCPYLVRLICSSEFHQIRFRFVKNLFSTKLDKVPFEALARFLFYKSPKEQASEALVLLLSSLRCSQITDDGEEDDLGSIFEIECDSAPPSTISFRRLSAAAINAAIKHRDKDKQISIRDLSLTYERAKGIHFENMERTPFRPEVENHPGKLLSYTDAIQDDKKSVFKAFFPRPERFFFTDWPRLSNAKCSTITFALKTVTPALPLRCGTKAPKCVVGSSSCFFDGSDDGQHCVSSPSARSGEWYPADERENLSKRKREDERLNPADKAMKHILRQMIRTDHWNINDKFFGI